MPVTSTARAGRRDGRPGARRPPSGVAERPARPRVARLGAAPAAPPARDWRSASATCLLAASGSPTGCGPTRPPARSALNPEDQTLYEWFLAHDARLLRRRLRPGHRPAQRARRGQPDGQHDGHRARRALRAGDPARSARRSRSRCWPPRNLAATAIAWYLLLRRTLGATGSPPASAAAFCGFAPGMVSQTNSHLHMTAQWLVPAMVWCVVRLARAADREPARGRAGRHPPDRSRPRSLLALLRGAPGVHRRGGRSSSPP